MYHCVIKNQIEPCEFISQTMGPMFRKKINKTDQNTLGKPYQSYIYLTGPIPSKN